MAAVELMGVCNGPLIAPHDQNVPEVPAVFPGQGKGRTDKRPAEDKAAAAKKPEQFHGAHGDDRHGIDYLEDKEDHGDYRRTFYQVPRFACERRKPPRRIHPHLFENIMPDGPEEKKDHRVADADPHRHQARQFVKTSGKVRNDRGKEQAKPRQGHVERL
jgi:hypothetical protein